MEESFGSQFAAISEDMVCDGYQGVLMTEGDSFE
jgi:hypothetical protein